MNLPRLPLPGETVAGGSLSSCLGGKGANQAVACYRAGADTLFISCIGDDSISKTVLAELAKTGLAIDAVVSIADCATGTACIFVDNQAENCIGLTAGANDRLTAELVLQYRPSIEHASILLLQLENPLGTVASAAQLASSLGTKVVLNPAPARELPDALFAHISLLTPNRGELAQLTGVDTDSDDGIRAAAKQLLAKGVDSLVVTLGKEGAMVFEADPDGARCQRFPAYVVDAVDTTAAGDTFNGYLVAALAQHWDISGAMATAMAAAALSVQTPGAIPSIPEQAQLAAFVSQYDQS